MKTSLDFFLSGRSLPAWITGLAFISANLGATEILGMAANSAQYGVYTVHWYWIGAIPAMVFLGLVMMPFYYGSKVRSVPEFLLLRFDRWAHLLSSILFAFAAILIAGVNLYALAIVVEALLGWPQWVAIVVAGFFVLAYITLGGLSSAIYNEVLQFFVILAALIPITVLGLKKAGGWDGLTDTLTSPTAPTSSPRGAAPASAGQPTRRQLADHRAGPGLRALLRLLDDELRRGATRALREEPLGRPAHPADRGVPQDLHRVPGDDPGPGRRGPGPGFGTQGRGSSTTTRSPTSCRTCCPTASWASR